LLAEFLMGSAEFVGKLNTFKKSSATFFDGNQLVFNILFNSI